MIIELIGYLGSILVLLSFAMSSVVKLRIINSIGGFVFAIYALIIRSYPTAIMNMCLVAINMYYLYCLRKDTPHFDMITGKSEDHFLNYILDYYRDDIKTYFSEWNRSDKKVDVAYLVCCDASPAGVLLGRYIDEKSLEILVDYSTPVYRDCSVGKYLYSRLQEKGIQTLVFNGNLEKHEGYLKKMGFVKEQNLYTKVL